MPRERFPEYAAFVAKYGLEHNIKKKLNNCTLERTTDCEGIDLYYNDEYVVSVLENESNFEIGYSTVDMDRFIVILNRLNDTKPRSVVEFGPTQIIEEQQPTPISHAIIKQIKPNLSLIIGPHKTVADVTEKFVMKLDDKHGMIKMYPDYLIINHDHWYVVLLSGECLRYEVFGRKNTPYEFVDWCRAMETWEIRPRQSFVKQKRPRGRFH